jgi:Flp pilus assembly protein TadB
VAVNSQYDGLFAILLGALAGAGVFGFIVAVRGLPVRPPGQGPSLTERIRAGVFSWRFLIAVIAGVLTLVLTKWVVAGIGIGVLAYFWKSLGGAASERAGMARLEALATWTESLRDTMAGAAGLEAAIPASIRIADQTIAEPLMALVERLHTRVPMHEALRRFADDLDDPSADLIIASLIINSRLRGPGLRDLLGSLAASVREELDMRRRVNASRRSTRRGAQWVIGVSVGMTVGLAFTDTSLLSAYDSVVGQLILILVAGIYAVGILWLRRLAMYTQPERLLVGMGMATPAEQAQQGMVNDGDQVWTPARGGAR